MMSGFSGTRFICMMIGVTITYNSGDEPVTISDKLLSKLEERDKQDKFLFLNGNGPPKQKSRLKIGRLFLFYTYSARSI